MMIVRGLRSHGSEKGKTVFSFLWTEGTVTGSTSGERGLGLSGLKLFYNSGKFLQNLSQFIFIFEILNA